MDSAPLRLSDKSGFALISIMVVVAAVAGVALVVAQLSLSARGEQRSQVERLQAQYAAEAALAASMVELQSGGDGIAFSQQQPLVLGGAEAFVGVNQDQGGNWSLEASGRSGRQRFGAELVTAQVQQSFWQQGAFGDLRVTFNSNSRIDSYDSSQGPYSASNGKGNDKYHSPHGDIASNGDIHLDSNASIWGDALVGPTGSFTTNSNATLNGSWSNNSQSIVLEPVVMPSFPAGGNLHIGSGHHVIPSGDVDFNNIQLNSNSTMHIVGPARVTCRSLRADSNVYITIDDSAGPVEIFIERDFALSSNAWIKPVSEDPAGLSIQVEGSSGGNITFDSNAYMYGTLYAPNHKINFNSNFELWGALAAKQLHFNSNVEIHYDENLSSGSSGGSSDWTVVGWRLTGANY
ncbi:MAG: hypothetical protein AAFZ65_11905 [Planctomycetota bacterium]